MLFAVYCAVYGVICMAIAVSLNECLRSGDGDEMDMLDECAETRALIIFMMFVGMQSIWMSAPFITPKALTWTVKFKAAGALFFYQFCFSILVFVYSLWVFNAFFTSDGIETKLLLRLVGT